MEATMNYIPKEDTGIEIWNGCEIALPLMLICDGRDAGRLPESAVGSGCGI